MPLIGEYEPSTNAWPRKQAETIHESAGAEGTTAHGAPVVLLTAIGAKTGKLRRTPLVRVEHEGIYAVVASLEGADRSPDWYHNVVANPDVELRDGTQCVDRRAREVFDDERAVWWERAIQVWPSYIDYQTKTDRLIPIFVLE